MALEIVYPLSTALVVFLCLAMLPYPLGLANTRLLQVLLKRGGHVLQSVSKRYFFPLSPHLLLPWS